MIAFILCTLGLLLLSIFAGYSWSIADKEFKPIEKYFAIAFLGVILLWIGIILI